jgi:hypothetical protein
METVNNSGDINWAWENINEKIKTSATHSLGMYELMQQKPRLDKECL